MIDGKYNLLRKQLILNQVIWILLGPEQKGGWNSMGGWKNSEKLIVGGEPHFPQYSPIFSLLELFPLLIILLFVELHSKVILQQKTETAQPRKFMTTINIQFHNQQKFMQAKYKNIQPNCKILFSKHFLHLKLNYLISTKQLMSMQSPFIIIVSLKYCQGLQNVAEC